MPLYLLAILLFAMIIFLSSLIRKYMIHRERFREATTAFGKIVVITGGNKGIGRETATELAKRGAKVYILCRDIERGIVVKNAILKDDPLAKVILHEVDLLDFASIRKFAEFFTVEENRLDILICNAGAINNQFNLSIDGIECTWQQNYLGHFLLTNLLLSHLSKSLDGRVINVSSKNHTYPRKSSVAFKLNSINDPSNFSKYGRYNMTKLAQIMNSKYMSENLHQTSKIHFLSCSPGVVNTDIITNAARFKTMLPVYRFFFRFFMKNGKEGAQTSLYLALSQEVIGKNGKYFVGCKEVSHDNSMIDDNDACLILYKESMKAIQFNQNLQSLSV